MLFVGLICRRCCLPASCAMPPPAISNCLPVAEVSAQPVTVAESDQPPPSPVLFAGSQSFATKYQAIQELLRDSVAVPSSMVDGLRRGLGELNEALRSGDSERSENLVSSFLDTLQEAQTRFRDSGLTIWCGGEGSSGRTFTHLQGSLSPSNSADRNWVCSYAHAVKPDENRSYPMFAYGLMDRIVGRLQQAEIRVIAQSSQTPPLHSIEESIQLLLPPTVGPITVPPVTVVPLTAPPVTVPPITVPPVTVRPVQAAQSSPPSTPTVVEPDVAPAPVHGAATPATPPIAVVQEPQPAVQMPPELPDNIEPAPQPEVSTPHPLLVQHPSRRIADPSATASPAALADARYINRQMSGLWYNREEAFKKILEWTGPADGSANRLADLRTAFDELGYGNFDRFMINRVGSNWARRWISDVCNRDFVAALSVLETNSWSNLHGLVARPWCDIPRNSNRSAAEAGNNGFDNFRAMHSRPPALLSSVARAILSGPSWAVRPKAEEVLQATCHNEQIAAEVVFIAVRANDTRLRSIALDVIKQWGDRWERLNAAFNEQHPESRNYFSHAGFHNGIAAENRDANEQPQGGTLHTWLCYNLTWAGTESSTLSRYIQIRETQAGQNEATVTRSLQDLALIYGNSRWHTRASTLADVFCDQVAGVQTVNGAYVFREGAENSPGGDSRVRNLRRIWDDYYIWRRWENSDGSPTSDWNGHLGIRSRFVEMLRRGTSEDARVRVLLGQLFPK